MSTNSYEADGATERPACTIADTIGDAFRLVLRVSSALDSVGRRDLGTEFWERAYRAPSFDRALAIAREYIEIAPPSTGEVRP